MKKSRWQADSEVRTSIKKLKAWARLYYPKEPKLSVKVEDSIEPGYWHIRVKCERNTFEDLVKQRPG